MYFQLGLVVMSLLPALNEKNQYLKSTYLLKNALEWDSILPSFDEAKRD